MKQVDELLVPAGGAHTFKNIMHRYSLHELQNNACLRFGTQSSLTFRRALPFDSTLDNIDL